jgi:hypothetical protein
MIFRQIKYSDLKLFSKLVRDLWCFDDFCINVSHAKYFNAVAVSQLFASSNFSLVIEENQEPKAFLLAKFNNRKFENKNQEINLKIINHLERARRKLSSIYSFESFGISEYLRIAEGFEKLQFEIPKSSSNVELVFFCAVNNARGKGYSTLLLNAFTDICTENRIKQIYLLTDEQCTYTYYDYQKFSKIKTLDEKLCIGSKEISNKIFLYVKDI